MVMDVVDEMLAIDDDDDRWDYRKETQSIAGKLYAGGSHGGPFGSRTEGVRIPAGSSPFRPRVRQVKLTTTAREHIESCIELNCSSNGSSVPHRQDEAEIFAK